MEDLLTQTVSSLRSMVDADTIVGRTLTCPDNTTWVVPISRITVGLVTGSGDYAQGKKEAPYSAGGGGAGGSVFPIGFLVLKDSGVQFVAVDREEPQNKWLALVNSAFEAIKSSKKA